jgi:6-phosphogluconate dehydrogenase (decarboxylating)
LLKRFTHGAFRHWKEERITASEQLGGPEPSIKLERMKFVEQIRQALYASKIVSYTQGYMLMRAAAKEYGWNLNYGGIALMWRGGCIIRSRFLGDIKKAFDQNPNLTNLLLDGFFKQAIQGCQQAWRAVVAAAVTSGIPVPAFSTALAFYDGFRSARLPANLLQAQRDYFARIRTRGSIDRGGNSFTPIGPGTAVKSRRVATTYSGVLRKDSECLRHFDFAQARLPRLRP